MTTDEATAQLAFDFTEPAEPVFTVGCFFGCKHIVRGADPDANHAAMEEHYAAAHRADTDWALAGCPTETRAQRTARRNGLT